MRTVVLGDVSECEVVA